MSLDWNEVLILCFYQNSLLRVKTATQTWTIYNKSSGEWLICKGYEDPKYIGENFYICQEVSLIDYRFGDCLELEQPLTSIELIQKQLAAATEVEEILWCDVCRDYEVVDDLEQSGCGHLIFRDGQWMGCGYAESDMEIKPSLFALFHKISDKFSKIPERLKHEFINEENWILAWLEDCGIQILDYLLDELDDEVQVADAWLRTLDQESQSMNQLTETWIKEWLVQYNCLVYAGKFQ